MTAAAATSAALTTTSTTNVVGDGSDIDCSKGTTATTVHHATTLIKATTTKKRRLSRKEQKTLSKQNKKKKQNVETTTTTTTTAATPPLEDKQPITQEHHFGSSSRRYIDTENNNNNNNSYTIVKNDDVGDSVTDQNSSRITNHSFTATTTTTNNNHSTAAVSNPPIIQQQHNHTDYLTAYTPIPFSDSNATTTTTTVSSSSTSSTTRKGSSLGKWFPKAIQLKRPMPMTPYEGGGGNTAAVPSDAPLPPQQQQQQQPSPKPKPKMAAILLFYQYMTPVWSLHKLRQVQEYLVRIGQCRVTIAGRIRIAPEGLNCTLSAIDDIDTDAITTLHYFVQDLYAIDDIFRTHTDFKYITHLTSDRHFQSYNILPVQELVYYGFPKQPHGTISSYHHDTSTDDTVIGKVATTMTGAKHVPPEVFHRLLAGEDCTLDDNDNGDGSIIKKDDSMTSATVGKARKDIVVIDVRNHYEAALGRFDGQEMAAAARTPKLGNVATPTTTTTKSVAKYIDPMMRKSTDFPLWVQKNASELLQKDRILLYCTGGIRCERASEHLSAVLETELQQYRANKKNDDTINNIEKEKSPEIYQLEGGVEKYLQTFPQTGGFWRGKNFTFDKREAISVDNMNGDGGVVVAMKRGVAPKQATTTTRTDDDDDEGASSNNPQMTTKMKKTHVISECTCVMCHAYWDRYIGKKKCCTCGVPILVCDVCCSTRKEETRTMGKCPICVQEQITIPVSEVAYTNNGKETKLRPERFKSSTNGSTNSKERVVVPKASGTVLKWGGGHGTNHINNKQAVATSSSVLTPQQQQKRKCKFGSDCHRTDCIFMHPNT